MAQVRAAKLIIELSIPTILTIKRETREAKEESDNLLVVVYTSCLGTSEGAKQNKKANCEEKEPKQAQGRSLQSVLAAS